MAALRKKVRICLPNLAGGTEGIGGFMKFSQRILLDKFGASAHVSSQFA